MAWFCNLQDRRKLFLCFELQRAILLISFEFELQNLNHVNVVELEV